MSAASKAAEARLYWHTMSDVQRRRREGADAADLADGRDELETVAEITTWPRLRALCIAAAAALQPAKALAEGPCAFLG